LTDPAEDFPNALTFDANGSLWGMTEYALFKLSPGTSGWTETFVFNWGRRQVGVPPLLHSSSTHMASSGHRYLGRTGVQGRAVKLLLGISKITNKTASQPWGLFLNQSSSGQIIGLRSNAGTNPSRFAALYDLTVPRSKTKSVVVIRPVLASYTGITIVTDVAKKQT
jgi:hypothetical protein